MLISLIYSISVCSFHLYLIFLNLSILYFKLECLFEFRNHLENCPCFSMPISNFNVLVDIVLSLLLVFSNNSVKLFAKILLEVFVLPGFGFSYQIPVCCDIQFAFFSFIFGNLILNYFLKSIPQFLWFSINEVQNSKAILDVLLENVDIRDDLHTLGDPVWDTLTYFWVLPSFFPGTPPSQQDNTQRLWGGGICILNFICSMGDY